MPNTKMYYVVWLVYGYTAWIVGAYAWDWWKKFRRRKRQAAGGENNGPTGDPLNEHEELTTSSAAVTDQDLQRAHDEL